MNTQFANPMRETPGFGLACRSMTAVAACALALLVQGCANPSYTITPEAHAKAAKAQPVAPKPEDFPALDKAVWKQGDFANLDNLRQMRTGMGKDQVRQLLGWPHFSEGLWGVSTWNYIFHFRTGKGAEFVTCQYMVRFNGDMLTEGMYWKGPDCELLLNPPQVRPVAVVPPPPPVARPAQKVTLGADGLFKFNGSSMDDLLPEGRNKLVRLAQDIRGNFKSVHYVLVTGHTDRLGSDAYNEVLSQARANTVRELLVQNGIDRKVIRTTGMGKRQPVSECAGSEKTTALVQCLQPNRRVELEIAGEQ
ncbi:OmpA family protein [Ottowia thiooxydans]|uniref:OmpA family protein n=1 Tax=Ottowia thiooxydans TaxID=219182 RepID=UPI0006865E92|nr:OmpA family protein [Ottowia thiooxydans]